MLAVDPTARRQGIARALVDACLARARADGAREVVISSLPDMVKAHGLYARLGFVRAPGPGLGASAVPGPVGLPPPPLTPIRAILGAGPRHLGWPSTPSRVSVRGLLHAYVGSSGQSGQEPFAVDGDPAYLAVGYQPAR